MAGGGGTQSPEAQQAAINAALENKALSNYLYYIIACTSAAVIIWRVWTVIVKYVRTVACLNNDNQRYFVETDSKFAWIKRNVLYAPIFSKRHNREIQMSSAINVGTLPSRLQLLFLAGYLGTNIAFCVINIPFAGSFAAAASQLRNRTGTLAVVNMVRADSHGLSRVFGRDGVRVCLLACLQANTNLSAEDMLTKCRFPCS